MSTSETIDIKKYEETEHWKKWLDLLKQHGKNEISNFEDFISKYIGLNKELIECLGPLSSIPVIMEGDFCKNKRISFDIFNLDEHGGGSSVFLNPIGQMKFIFRGEVTKKGYSTASPALFILYMGTPNGFRAVDVIAPDSYVTSIDVSNLIKLLQEGRLETTFMDQQEYIFEYKHNKPNVSTKPATCEPTPRMVI